MPLNDRGISDYVYLYNGGSFLRRSSGIINLVKSHSKMVLVSFPGIIRDLLPFIRCLGDLYADKLFYDETRAPPVLREGGVDKRWYLSTSRSMHLM